ncbi:MAG: ABC transporter substrate-binding protein [Bacillota bacterium]|nr:ABC transporter substrate-binding protein [Bacillota bacterium]
MGRLKLKAVALLVAGVLAGTCILPGCAQKPREAKPGRGGALTIAIPQDPVALDVHRTSWADIVHSLIYDPLLTLDLDRKYVPQLAESWNVSPDGKEITIKLRKDVKFHDGKRLNAEAVKFTYDRLKDPAMAAPFAGQIGPLEQVVAADEYTVKMVYKEPFAPFFYVMDSAYLGIMSPEAVRTLGDNFNRSPVSTGPFIVEEWVPGDHLSYKRNEDYRWPAPYYENRGPAYFEKVVMKIIPDENTRVLALEKGDIDITDVPTTAVPRLRGNPDVTLHETLTEQLTYLGFNFKKYPWTEAPVRQAIAHAINREEIITQALEGMAVPAWGPLVPAMSGYWEGIKDYAPQYAPDKVKPLLAQAGWDKVDSEGFVVKDGKRLTLDIMTYPEPDWVRVGEVVVSQLRKVGVDARLKTVERATLLASTPKGEHDAILILYGYRDPDILFYFFHSSRLPTTNRCHYVNPKVDELLERGRTTVNPDQRTEVYREVQITIMQDGVWVPLYVPKAVTGVRKEVKGFKVHPVHGGWLLHDAYKEIK